LRQIVDAPPDEKENLLKDLEAFAFRGIPELRDGKIKGFMTTCLNPVRNSSSSSSSSNFYVGTIRVSYLYKLTTVSLFAVRFVWPIKMITGVLSSCSLGIHVR
jgi:hypothetical protein